MSKPIVHLHCHTSASTMHSIDGLNTPDDLVNFAKKTKAGAIAITDHGNVAAHIAFWKTCKKHNVKPILGCEFYLIPDAKTQKDQGFGRGKSFHITVLAQNQVGWHNMMKLVSISNSPGFFHYEPRIDWISLTTHKEGLIILSGCPKGLISRPFCEGDEPLAEQRAGLMVKEFGENFYFEVQDSGLRELDLDQAKLNSFLRKMAKLYSRPTVFTMDTHFPTKADHEAHQYLIGIMTGRNIHEVVENKGIRYANEYYLKTRKECLEWDCKPEEIDESQRIAERIESFDVGVGGRHLPTISNNSNDIPIEQLRKLALDGWKKFDIGSRSNKDEYAARMKKELADIEQAGMAEYFLLVHDVVSWGKARGIPFGSGRGSAGGSLTLYLLGVTGKDLDPIKWGLVWERFYNVGRSHSFPDVDIDVAKENREEVIQYIADRFGDDRVSQLITFGRMTARSVLKDVMRTHGIPFDEANEVTGLIPPKNDDHATDISLKEAFDINPKLADAEKKYPKVFEIARKLEGKYRGYGVHAAAVIINDQSFQTGNLPLVRDKSGKKLICGWSMEEVDELGYLKLDILGLNELDIIHHALGLVKSRRGIDVDFEDFPQNNKQAFQMLSDGRTEGVFQMRSNLGRTWCKSIQPKNIEEISAIAALIRPACLDAGMTRRYAKIKHGEEQEVYIHDALKPILGPTHSVYVYQEQALQMCAMVGMTLSEADIVRKAIGKKKPELLAKQEKRFLELARENGYTEIAEQLWNYIKEGAGYGFNKCVSGDTLIVRASGNQHQGREISIAELWRYYHGDKRRSPAGKKYRNATHPRLGLRVLAMKNGRVKIDRIKDVIQTGTKSVYQMTLDTGHSIKATLGHRFYTDRGWCKLGEVAIGDYIHTCGNYEHTKYDYSFSRTAAKNRLFRKGIAYYRNGQDNTGYINGEFCRWKSAKAIKMASVDCCEKCGDKHDRLELAHLDGDRTNNLSSNLRLLCPSCHKQHDYTKNSRNRRFDKGYPIVGAKVIDISYAGEEMTYDIEMCGTEHNYVANGIITHNSHSVAYSLLSYKNAYLKANYPPEFFCANMIKCANLGDKHKSLERIKELINDAKIADIQITPPSIRVCNMDFEIIDEHTIAFGLSHIHGVGVGGLRAVSKCKSAEDFYHFLRLAHENKVNRRVMEGLIRSGACDLFGMPRKQMELEYTTIQDLPKKERDYTLETVDENGLVPLIETMGEEDTVDDRKAKKIFVPNINRRAKLRILHNKLYEESVFNDDKEWNLQNEHQYLGCPLSGNFEDIFTSLPSTGHNCLDTLSMENDQKFQLCVQIDDVRIVHTKKDRKPMAFLSVSDKTYGLKDVVIFPKTYTKYGELLVPNSIVRLWCFYNDGVKAWKIQQISKIKTEIF